MLNNIEYLAKKSEFRLGDVKNLAVMVNQKDDMARMFPKNDVTSLSNADMLSQNFGGNSVNLPNENPIQISAIPNVQNTFNMESKPVDLNMNSVGVNSTIPSFNGNAVTNSVQNPVVTPSIPEMPVQSLDNNSISNNAPIIEPINANSTANSEFNVGGGQNIFDTPSNLNTSFNITQEEINKPLDNNIGSTTDLNVVNDMPSPDVNIFSQPSVSNVPEVSNNNETKEDLINDDIILAQIAIEESNVKHYKALAENAEKKIEILKRQLKKKTDGVNLENTASDLFNNNGSLNDEKILGKTPMPNIMAA